MDYIHSEFQNLDSILAALRLHRRLQCVNWREYHSERSRRKARKDRLDKFGHLLHVGVRAQQRKNTYIRRGVTKTRYRALHESCEEAGVVSGKAAIVI